MEGNSLGGVKGIWCSDNDPYNFKYSFPFLSTSLLHLTASYLGKVFAALDLCGAQILMNIRQNRQYSSCQGPDD